MNLGARLYRLLQCTTALAAGIPTLDVDRDRARLCQILDRIRRDADLQTIVKAQRLLAAYDNFMAARAALNSLTASPMRRRRRA